MDAQTSSRQDGTLTSSFCRRFANIAAVMPAGAICGEVLQWGVWELRRRGVGGGGGRGGGGGGGGGGGCCCGYERLKDGGDGGMVMANLNMLALGRV